MLTRLLTAMIVVCAAGGLFANELKVGDDAPQFKAGGKLINPPEFARELSDCKNNVVLIYEWNIRDGTAAGLKTIQKYWDDYQGKGLNVFTISRLDFEKWPVVESYCRRNDYTFPVAMGGFYDEDNAFYNYKAEKGFRATVISADHKIAFWGIDEWEEPLKAELEKVEYPNLGKDEVHPLASRAAKYFVDRDFGRALQNAAEIIEKEDMADEAIADARRMVDFAEDLAKKRNDRVEKWKEEGRYDLAYSTLEALESEFEGHEIGDKASEARKEMSRDRDLKKELKAYEMLDTLKERRGTGSWTGYVSALRAFAEAQKDFKAGAVAKKLADEIEFVMDE